MKKILTFLIIIFFQFVFGQEDYSKYKPIEPLYDNGKIENFYEYLTKSIDFKKVKDEDDVIVAFVLDKNGKMNHLKVGFCKNNEAEKEIMLALQRANNWDLSNQKNKNHFICFKIKLFFLNNTVKGLSKVMWFKEDVEDVKININEFNHKDVKSSDNNDNNLYSTAGIEVKPEFPGGISEFYKFIGDNYRIPRVRDFSGGKVIVTFVIEKDGSVTEIKVLKDLGLGTGEEAIRVLKNCPKWKPGEQNGKKVRVSYALPINLQGNK